MKRYLIDPDVIVCLKARFPDRISAISQVEFADNETLARGVCARAGQQEVIQYLEAMNAEANETDEEDED